MWDERKRERANMSTWKRVYECGPPEGRSNLPRSPWGSPGAEGRPRGRAEEMVRVRQVLPAELKAVRRIRGSTGARCLSFRRLQRVHLRVRTDGEW